MGDSEVPLPLIVERMIEKICFEQSQPPPDTNARKILASIGEESSIHMLKIISQRRIRTFTGFIKYLAKDYKPKAESTGLLDDDDKEWDEVLHDCSKCGDFSPQIRELFIHIIIHCNVKNPNKLWHTHWCSMSEDILLKWRNSTKNTGLQLTDMELQYYTLAEIDKLLKCLGKSLKDFHPMPQLPPDYMIACSNVLIMQELSYDCAEMKKLHDSLFTQCNADQLRVYNAVMNSVQNQVGGFFFVYDSGGCGKTFLWNTLICRLRSEGKIVLPVASSGIAATIMPGGRTAHSRFKIPIILDEFSTCSISVNSDIAELIQKTSLIIWDEAPMQHRYAFEALDRSLRDIMKIVSKERFHMPFGGLTVVLGGDFRQILPVVNRGSRADIVSACITRSRLWSSCEVFTLKKNMRLDIGKDNFEIEKLRNFGEWVLSVGDGKNNPSITTSTPCDDDEIQIPHQFCNLESDNSVNHLITNTYPNFIENYKCSKYLSERAILSPTNEIVGHVNALLVERIDSELHTYCSVDSAEEFGGAAEELNSSFPVEYLNSINIPGIPCHELRLKVGVVVMLIRNLNQALGLCNGTRMTVTKCLPKCVECVVLSGNYVGSKHFIPRMEISPTDSRLPFKLIRKQMPLQICYAMTINKYQGQSLKKVGLYLPKPVFTHGQLYVAVSRVTNADGLKIFIDSEDGSSTSVTQNVVYKEIFSNLPVVKQ